MGSENPERKLDFHAPLLSTRRPGRIIVPRERWEMNSSTGFNDRVPFSWEQSPGKPKEAVMKSLRKAEETKNMALVLPLKPPPVRLHPNLHREEDSEDDDDAYDDDDDDDGCDGDVDDNEEDFDFLSGRLDLLSLAESSTNNTSTKKSKRVVVQSPAGGRARNRAPPTQSFIMERFLPAAVALAASSSSYSATLAPRTMGPGPGIGGCNGDAAPRRVLPSASSPLALKSCGLEILLPWRARPKKYAVRGPIRFGCSDWKPQLEPRPK